MSFINNFFQSLVAGTQTARREEGQGTVEYVLVTGLIAVILVLAAVTPLTDAVTDAVGRVTAALA